MRYAGIMIEGETSLTNVAESGLRSKGRLRFQTKEEDGVSMEAGRIPTATQERLGAQP
jgi:hypothetical protein